MSSDSSSLWVGALRVDMVLSSEMSTVAITPKCRSPAEGRTKIEQIYISLLFPFLILATPPQSWAEERSKSNPSLFVVSLSTLPHPDPPLSTRGTDPSPFSRSAHSPALFSSLTRFQRKNGLFKKAYELGVLCSVDVAVIVFDNKQGGPRLYQYGSDDVVTIVERAMRVCATPLPPQTSAGPCFSPVRG